MAKPKARRQNKDSQHVRLIEDAGWRLTSMRSEGIGRFVARKITHERKDESETRLYESSFTLEALARQVTRREREEGFAS